MTSHLESETFFFDRVELILRTLSLSKTTKRREKESARDKGTFRGGRQKYQALVAGIIVGVRYFPKSRQAPDGITGRGEEGDDLLRDGKDFEPVTWSKCSITAIC